MSAVVSTAAIPGRTDRVAVLFNQRAGPGDSHACVERLHELLEQRGFATELFTDLDAAAREANRWHAEGRLRALVGVGGDGTAAELINRAVEGAPLTFLPAGNSNLLAGYFGLRKEPEAVCRVITDGLIARVDAGEANGRLFSLMAGCGFDAEVVRRVHAVRTGHISRASYAMPILQSIGSYDFPEIRIQWPEFDAVEPAVASWLFAFNLPCYGGGLRIAPQADGSDGLLDVCCMRRGHLWPGLWYAAALLARQHRRLADFSARRATRVRISSDGEVPYQLDGDPGGTLPLDIRIVPGRLTLLVPAEVVSGRRETT